MWVWDTCLDCHYRSFNTHASWVVSRLIGACLSACFALSCALCMHQPPLPVGWGGVGCKVTCAAEASTGLGWLSTPSQMSCHAAQLQMQCIVMLHCYICSILHMLILKIATCRGTQSSRMHHTHQRHLTGIGTCNILPVRLSPAMPVYIIRQLTIDPCLLACLSLCRLW